MKCAGATAGIASVITGLAVVLSSAPAHSTFLYLNQSQLISAAISSSVAASPTGEGPELQLSYGHEDVAPVVEEAQASETLPANVEIVHGGTQLVAANVYGNDSDSYSAPAGFRWMTPRSSMRADSALPRYRADSNTTRPSSGTPAAPSPSKDSPGGSSNVTTPIVTAPSNTAPSTPVVTPPAVTPPSTTVPGGSASPPPESDPISLPPTQDTPIVGVPSTSVPEPSTVGLLGIGLLLVFVAIGRGKRTRYYSRVSGSPRSSREMGSLARSLNQ